MKNVLETTIVFTEFPLAITLMCLNYPLLSIESNKNDPQRLGFVFEKNVAIERLIKAYWGSNLLIEPKKFWNMSREIKSRIRSNNNQY